MLVGADFSSTGISVLIVSLSIPQLNLVHDRPPICPQVANIFATVQHHCTHIVYFQLWSTARGFSSPMVERIYPNLQPNPITMHNPSKA